MMTSFERVISAAESAGLRVRYSDDRDRADIQAPGHSSADRSVSVKYERDGCLTVVNCHAPDTHTRGFLGHIGLSLKDLFDAPKGPYRYPDGREVTRVQRPDGKKTFYQKGNKNGRALFGSDRMPADLAETIHVVEGEKDVMAIRAAGGHAVCNAMGAGKAVQFDWSPLVGRPVVIVADADQPGRGHARHVRGILAPIATSVKIVGAKEGKDAADHLALGYTLDDFQQLDLADDEGEGATFPRPRLYAATELKGAEKPTWLARGRIVYGAVNLLVGPEGIGKSLAWVLIAAKVTTGALLPEFGIPSREPGHVIVVITEDDWATVVRPRLEVAGADLARISVVCTEPDGSGTPVFPADMHLITSAEPAPALVVVDAWLDTVTAKLSVKDPQQARQGLHPWKEAAGQTGAAVLLLTHTNRVSSSDARDTYGATGELRKKARVCLYAQAGEEEGHLLIGPEKANHTRKLPATKFQIAGVARFAASDDDDGTVPLLHAVGDSDKTIGEHVADRFAAVADPKAARDSPERVGAVGWLQDYLSLQPGLKAPAEQVRRDGKTAGFSVRTLQRAAKDLEVMQPGEGFPRITYWVLPEHKRREPPDDGGKSRQVGPISQNGAQLDFSGTTVPDQEKQVGATGVGSTVVPVAPTPGDTGEDGATATRRQPGKCA
ncbi:AAA family ATPase [Gordonia amicalis]|uniref:AAA family ATPase n=1 Tax=Gordonia amicalis TaxID=89053 RepID=UPI001FFA3CC2|nr:AAA family ATPase [Gordonia amicalis]